MTLNVLTSKSIEGLVQSTRVLVIDDDFYMRKVIRSLLLAHGIRNVTDAADGKTGLEAICMSRPDAVVLDWELPDMTGADVMRIIRAPGSFPVPAVPVIMLTGHVDRETVVGAVKLGINEFLCKPVSAKTLYDRIVAVRTMPRPMVRIGDYYGPEPRKVVANAKAATDLNEPLWLT